MCTTKFYLDTRSKKDKKKVIMRVNHASKAFNKGTGIEISPEDWDSDLGFPKDKTSPEFVELAAMEKLVERSYDVLKQSTGQKPSMEALKATIEAVMAKEESEDLDTISGMIQAFIEQKFSIYDQKTIRHYIMLKALVVNKFYETLYDRLEHLNKTWALKFIDYLCYEEGYQNSTVEMYLKKLNSVLNFFDKPTIKISEVMKGMKKSKDLNPPKPFLSLNQVEEIVTNTVRDHGIYSDKGIVISLFEFASSTGIRFSDMMKLTENNIIEEDGVEILRYTASKNGRCIMIPLSDRCKSIITIYSHLTGKLLPQLTNSKCNSVLTDILKEYGCNEKQEVIRCSGSSRDVQEKTLADILSWHSSRRGFGSHLLSKGMTYQEVSDLMGVTVATLIKWYSSSNKKERNEKLLSILNNS